MGVHPGPSMTVAYRAMDSRDERFVLDSWSKSYRESDYAGLIQASDWFPIMLGQLAKVLRIPTVQVRVAYDPSDAERVADIYGWLCFDRYQLDVPLVYYAFVKSAYRRRGITRELFRVSGVDVDRPFVYVCRTYMLDDTGLHGMSRPDSTRSPCDQPLRAAPYAHFRPRAGRH